MDDVLILGGGVIGLSLAYELAGHGLSVRLLDRGAVGQEASWAGAGMLPPAQLREEGDPLEQLTGLSQQLHASWAEELRETTGIDNGFRVTGAIYVARSEDDVVALNQHADDCRHRGVAAERLDPSQLAELEPASRGASPEILAAWLLPEEAQIRNPRHLKALAIGCSQRGVKLEQGVAAEGFEVRDGRIMAVLTSDGNRKAGHVCICSGPWTGALAARLGIPLAMRPVRGQMVLLNAGAAGLRRTINEGNRYLVPRPDGRTLIGSTEEDAGFLKQTTTAGIAGLLHFGLGLAPGLSTAQVERTWAGLRPGTADRLPYLGPAPGLQNVWLASGHFRSGLQLSTGTAVVLNQHIHGVPPQINLAPFAVDRH